MRRHSGFTLIEVMVTIAIIAILAGIALPSYTSYIIRGKIQEATSNLLAMRTKMELYFQDNRTWAPAAPATPPCQPGTVAPLPASLKYFTLSCNNLTATTYTVQADGMGDLTGLQLTINEANVRKTVSVPAGWGTANVGANCWVAKKSGECQ